MVLVRKVVEIRRTPVFLFVTGHLLVRALLSAHGEYTSRRSPTNGAALECQGENIIGVDLADLDDTFLAISERKIVSEDTVVYCQNPQNTDKAR